jgi:hypothetical protein
MVCKRGLLYNRDFLLQTMVEKKMPFEFRHIRKLRDLITITKAECFDPEVKSLRCLISKEVLSEKREFSVYSCGCVLSTQAMNEVG